MVLFSIIFISVILITIQHLVNWVLRKKLDGGEFVLTVIATIISLILGYFLITWSIDWFLEMGWVTIIEDKSKPMLGFAFFGITTILISIQHLNNWMWRNVKDEMVALYVVISIISFFLTVWLESWFIIWGGSLINGVNYITL